MATDVNRPRTALAEGAAPAPSAVPPPPERGSARSALLRLGVVVAAGVLVAYPLHGLVVLLIIAFLVAMVMLHELGHFAVAKWSDMKVTQFFLGFGPRLWSVFRGETEYGIKAIPAGGYVRIVGMTTAEEVDPVDEPRSYRQASFPRRLAVGVAGSAMHVVISALLLFVMFVGTGVPTDTGLQVASLTPIVNVTSPARAAGIRPGDELVSVDGRAAGNPGQLIDIIAASPGKRLRLVIRRDGRERTVFVTPARRSSLAVASGRQVTRLSGNTGVIGVELNFLATNERTNPLVGVQRTATSLVSLAALTFEGIGDVFSPHGLSVFYHDVVTANQRQSKASSNSAEGQGSSGEVLSIYGVVGVAAQAAHESVPLALSILAEVCLFIGIINLFPMLPLDGGHVAIAVYERLRSRRGVRYHADVRKLTPVAALFLAFLVLLGLAALYVNILHPVSLSGG